MWDDPPFPYRKCAAIAGVLVLIALARAPVTWVAYVIPGSSAVVWDWIHRSRMQDGGVFRYGSIVHPEVTCYLEARHPNYSSVLDVACNHGIMLRRLQRSRPHAKFFGADVSEVMVNATRKRCPTCVVAQMNLADLLHERDARAPVIMRLTHSLTCVLLLTDHTKTLEHASFRSCYPRRYLRWSTLSSSPTFSITVRRLPSPKLSGSPCRLALIVTLWSCHSSLRRLATRIDQLAARAHVMAPPIATALLHATPGARSS